MVEHVSHAKKCKVQFLVSPVKRPEMTRAVKDIGLKPEKLLLIRADNSRLDKQMSGSG